MAIEREFSAGALVLRHMQDKWWVAVIEPARHGEPDDRKNIVALPKGNVDAGEKPEQAAIREVLEETGLHAKTIIRLASIRYVYSRKWAGGEKIFKVVTFYLMKYHSGRIGEIKDEMKHEVRRAYWLPLTSAAEKLSYTGERQMAKQASEYVDSHQQELLS
ncbi:MAG TPA: NUDIX domain-containing protein [Candidatus Angelobacter sp.]